MLQGALLGVVGLILAFGLSLAVGRYQDRRADVVTDANTIGTATCGRRRSPSRSEAGRWRSCGLNDLAIRLTYEVPGSAAIRATATEQGEVQRVLWRFAGESLDARPRDSAPRLYVDSLNEMIDQQTVRLSGLNNRVPDPVLWLELLGAALALGLLADLPLGARQGPLPDHRLSGHRQLPRPHHLRPRSADARSHRNSGDAALGLEADDEPAASSVATRLRDTSWQEGVAGHDQGRTTPGSISASPARIVRRSASNSKGQVPPPETRSACARSPSQQPHP